MKGLCVINGVDTTHYFKRERGVWQGDPISTYLLILCLEIGFFFKRLLRIINILKVLIFLEIPSYIQLIQMTWFFFLKKLGSIKELLNTISLISLFSSLKLNLSKCEVAMIGLLE